MNVNKSSIKTDLSKLDKHVITQEEYDDIPELTDDMMDRADLYHGDKLISRGRPKAESRKEAVSIRLDPEVLTAFREMGNGWQTRINDVLRDWIKTHPKPLKNP